MRAVVAVPGCELRIGPRPPAPRTGSCLLARRSGGWTGAGRCRAAQGRICFAGVPAPEARWFPRSGPGGLTFVVSPPSRPRKRPTLGPHGCGARDFLKEPGQWRRWPRQFAGRAQGASVARRRPGPSRRRVRGTEACAAGLKTLSLPGWHCTNPPHSRPPGRRQGKFAALGFWAFLPLGLKREAELAVDPRSAHALELFTKNTA